MTVLIVVAALTAGFAAGWLVCTRWHAALRLDRDLHEQDSTARADAMWKLLCKEEKKAAARRYLARLPQPRRVRVMSRWCRALQRQAAA